jgi:hypothetical protein
MGNLQYVFKSKRRKKVYFIMWKFFSSIRIWIDLRSFRREPRASKQEQIPQQGKQKTFKVQYQRQELKSGLAHPHLIWTRSIPHRHFNFCQRVFSLLNSYIQFITAWAFNLDLQNQTHNKLLYQHILSKHLNVHVKLWCTKRKEKFCFDYKIKLTSQAHQVINLQ